MELVHVNVCIGVICKWIIVSAILGVALHKESAPYSERAFSLYSKEFEPDDLP